ncbi:hypothetical protein [Sphingobium ummariense]|uniref:Uncharacterized protein n=1 Tax=Sphingobium ummariense RL-3 TaxID=1346791 RepID=T0IYS1_9SPHN|nr:hypothetical protein [Sphingobium ummariense]EQB29677.1 hypothetical protein M529_23145 [Sphingobium ummariense RL-3]
MKRREFLAAVALTSVLPFHAAFAQRTVQPQVVGTPFRRRWPDAPYARNIWTMEVFEDRLFLGAGNSANGGPSSNSGPVPVISYDGQAFAEEYTVNEEQITHFYPTGGSLIVPGHDSRDDWSYGNLYRRADGRWTKLRTVPHGIHVYDIRAYAGRLVAVGGAFDQSISAWISDDDAATWKPAALLPNPALAPSFSPAGRNATVLGHQTVVVGRFWTLLEIGDALYASTTAPLRVGEGEDGLRMATLFRFDSARNGFQPVAFGMPALFPGVPADGTRTGLVERWARIGQETVYIGGWQHNDHQWLPIGLFAATSPEKARRLALPADEQPWDILVRDGRLYCLSARREAPDRFRISVTRFERDLGKGKLLLSFDAPTFARSFAVFRGRFYFGLGTETDMGVPLSDASGTLLSTPFIP